MHPCCGKDLQKSAKCVAITEIVVYSISILFIIFLLLAGIIFGITLFAQHSATEEENNAGDLSNKDAKAVLIIFGSLFFLFMVIMALFNVISIIFSAILLKGTKQKSISTCQVWLVYRTIVWGLNCCFLVFGFFPSIFEIFLAPYFIWVVHSFVTELKQEQGQGVVYNPNANANVNNVEADEAPPKYSEY